MVGTASLLALDDDVPRDYRGLEIFNSPGLCFEVVFDDEVLES